MRRTTGLVLVGAGLAALLTGCSEAAPSPAPATATATASATASAASASSPAAGAATASSSPTASSAPSPSVSRVAAGRTDPDAPDGQCADADLRVDVRETGGGLGSRQDLIVLRNAGTTSCSLEGAPGVSVVGGGDGTQLGKPAGRSPGAASVVRLAPGEAVTAELDRVFVDGGTTGFTGQDGQIACDPEHGDGYRIYPPHSFRAVLVRHDVWACTSGYVWMRVAPVVAGR